jgi:site-specific DNA recombinase
MDKKAVIYARVSTDEQAERGYSLQTQIERCRVYAEDKFFEVVAELADDCSGTISVRERPQGKEIYTHVNNGGIDAVILYTHDRTARDEEVIEYLLFKLDLHTNGVELHYSDNGLDPYTMDGNLVGYIKAHAAAEERKKIIERSTRGKLAKAKSGKWMGSRPPFGYTKIGRGADAYLEINQEESAVVQNIYSLYLGLNGTKPMNILGIAVHLTAKGVPVSGRGRKSARGWTQETVRYILTNSAYIGKFRYADIIMPFPHLAIIDDEIFQAAQERRKKNAKRAKRNRKFDYLLVGGFLRCSCERSMVARTSHGSHKRYFYYACVNQRRRYLYGCKERHLRADIVDPLVWNWVFELLADETVLEMGIRRMAERSEVEISGLRQRIEVVINLHAEIEIQVHRLANAYAEAENETVAEALNAELKNAGNKLDALEDERARLLVEIDQGKLSPEEIAALKRLSAELREELQDASFETKRNVLDRLNFQAKLHHDDDGRKLKVSCSLVVEPVSLSIETSYSRPVMTFARSRSCWAIRTCARPWFIRTCSAMAGWRCSARWTILVLMICCQALLGILIAAPRP